MTYILQLLLLVAFGFGNLYKISFISPDIRVSLLDIAVGLVSVMWLIKKPETHKGIFRSLLLFLAWGLIGLSFSIIRFGQTAFIVGSMYWLRFLAYGTLGFSLLTIFSKIQLNKLLYYCGTILVVIGSWQYLFYPDIRRFQVSEWDPHYYRVVGTLLDPGYMGILLVLFLIYLYRFPLANKLHQYLLFFYTYLIFALTYSRSSYLALLAAAVSISFVKKSLRPLILTALILLLTIIILPRSPDGEGVKLERTSSIKARIENWKHSAAIFIQNPIFGVGFNTYRYAQKSAGFMDNSQWLKSHAGAGADSSLLFVGATTGLIGLCLYLNYLKNYFPLKTMSYELAALLIHSLFLNSLFYPYVLFWLGLLLSQRLSASENK